MKSKTEKLLEIAQKLDLNFNEKMINSMLDLTESIGVENMIIILEEMRNETDFE